MKLIVKVEYFKEAIYSNDVAYGIDLYMESCNRHATNGFHREHVRRFYGRTHAEAECKLYEYLREGMEIRLSPIVS